MSTKRELLHIIKAKCLDCSCYQLEEVRQCTDKNCELYPYRLGKDPFKKQKEITEKQLKVRQAFTEKARERAEEAQNKKKPNRIFS